MSLTIFSSFLNKKILYTKKEKEIDSTNLFRIWDLLGSAASKDYESIN